MAAIYLTTVAALVVPIDRSLLLYDVCNPEAVSSILLSNNGENLAHVVVDDCNSRQGIPQLYKDTNYWSLHIYHNTY
jgi:hypothetical protein